MKPGSLLHTLLCLALALGVSVVLFGSFVAMDAVGLAREQKFFAGGVLTYCVTAVYLLQQTLRRLPGLVRRAQVVAVVVTLPVALFFELFRLDVLPWPTSMGAYMVGAIVVAPVMAQVAEWWFLGRRERRETS
jgi:hypothetical protein